MQGTAGALSIRARPTRHPAPYDGCWNKVSKRNYKLNKNGFQLTRTFGPKENEKPRAPLEQDAAALCYALALLSPAYALAASGQMCPQAIPRLMHQHLLLVNAFLFYSFLPHSSQTAKINITYLASCHMFLQLCPVAFPGQSSNTNLNSAGLAPQGFSPGLGRCFLLSLPS